MSRFAQFLFEMGLDLRDVEVDEHGFVVLTDSGQAKVAAFVSDDDEEASCASWMT
jgi:hypothetical protein